MYVDIKKDNMAIMQTMKAVTPMQKDIMTLIHMMPIFLKHYQIYKT